MSNNFLAFLKILLRLPKGVSWNRDPFVHKFCPIELFPIHSLIKCKKNCNVHRNLVGWLTDRHHKHGQFRVINLGINGGNTQQCLHGCKSFGNKVLIYCLQIRWMSGMCSMQMAQCFQMAHAKYPSHRNKTYKTTITPPERNFHARQLKKQDIVTQGMHTKKQSQTISKNYNKKKKKLGLCLVRLESDKKIYWLVQLSHYCMYWFIFILY